MFLKPPRALNHPKVALIADNPLPRVMMCLHMGGCVGKDFVSRLKDPLAPCSHPLVPAPCQPKLMSGSTSLLCWA